MKINDVVKGKVTGIKPYGAFVQLEENVTGLIHISEISNGFVKNVNNFVKIGEEVEVKVIDMDLENNQARLSLKALHNVSRRSFKRLRERKPLQMTIGFDSIEQQLPQWIKDVKKEMEHHEI